MPDIFTSPPKPPKPSASLSVLSVINKFKKEEGGISTPFSAYALLPSAVRFETQEDDETIILLLRKHWITNILWITISAALLVAPIFIFPSLIFSGTLPAQITPSFMIFLALSWYLITFTYLFVNFIIWYFTVSIVTTERVVDIDFINIMNKKFAETRIARVEDVTARAKGIVGAFFDYGDVLVQTAATESEFQFESVPHPERVVRIINTLMGNEEEEGESG